MGNKIGYEKEPHEFSKHIGKYVEIYQQSYTFLGYLVKIIGDEAILNPHGGTIFIKGKPKLGWVDREIGTSLSTKVGYSITTKEDAEKSMAHENSRKDKKKKKRNFKKN